MSSIRYLGLTITLTAVVLLFQNCQQADIAKSLRSSSIVGGAGLAPVPPVVTVPSSIGEWVDSPGSCPAGMPRLDISTIVELENASREAAVPLGKCYFIRNGTYVQRGSTKALLINYGSQSATNPKIFIGESRTGVIIKGRATIADGAHNIVIRNMTFDISGFRYLPPGVPGSVIDPSVSSFDTLEINAANNITVDHLNLTGDCYNGKMGGHIATDGSSNVLIESNLIEKFGRCDNRYESQSTNGRLDHGIYLSFGSNIIIRNNIIRQNSSRGIQLYTAGGASGALNGIIIERNQVYENGHADSEDGIVISPGMGVPINISNVNIAHNIIRNNYYSGVRFSGNAMNAIYISKNTFVLNGAHSTYLNRSEINIDPDQGVNGASITNNIFSVGYTLVNDCSLYSASQINIDNNIVSGPVASNRPCVTNTLAIDPMLVNPYGPTYDLRTQNPVATNYGAFSP